MNEAKTEEQIDAERAAQIAAMPPAGQDPQSENPPQSVALPGSKREKPPILSGSRMQPIIPKSYEDAYRIATGFVAADMAPDSYVVKHDKAGDISSDGICDQQGTVARVALGIMKGMEIGLAPVTAVSTIMIVNNRTSVWGDGALALIQNSGKLEWIKDEQEGDWAKGAQGAFKVTVTAKRIDNPETIVRSFGFDDATRANLIGKRGPWSSGYGPRMCLMRARAWVLRDGFSDVLSGLGIVEEIRDYEVEAARNRSAPDASALDVGLIESQNQGEANAQQS
jgi:hypothetical protein